MQKYSKKAMALLNSVTGKRPRTVIDLILKNGQVTTEDLKKAGYEHAPRAVRDVRDLGIPIKTGRTKGEDGKNIAVYTFGDLEHPQNVASKKAGRNALTDKLKQKLLEKYGSRCFVYLEEMPAKELQVDHRIPYEIGGEQDQNDLSKFMLLSPSANRRKSWACEHCPNWAPKDVKMCETCFWAYPESYTHVAGEDERIVEILLREEQAEQYDAYVEKYGKGALNTAVKDMIADAVQDDTESELVAEKLKMDKRYHEGAKNDK